MTSREVVKRNLNFDGAERIAFKFSGGRLNDFCQKGVGGMSDPRLRRWTEGEFEYYDDIWGNVWFRMKGGCSGGEIFKPALEDWSQLDTYEPPDLADPSRYEDIRRVFSETPDRYRLGGVPGFPFAICRYLRKMENYFQDLVLERENIDRLHGMITGLIEKVIHALADSGADGIFFCEDWGTQQALLVSPDMWLDIYKPIFERLCGAAHERGMDVLMHSCGNIWEIIDHLADAGVNALQFDQPALYGIERLAGKLSSLKVCLYSPVDIQRVMPTGDKDLIVAEANKMKKLFGGSKRGLIAKNYPDLHGIGVNEEWDQWAYEAFVS